jgi:hypothetical protein
MYPTLPRQLHGDMRGLPPGSSVSSHQHSLHLTAPMLDTDALDAVRCMAPFGPQGGYSTGTGTAADADLLAGKFREHSPRRDVKRTLPSVYRTPGSS